MSELKRTQYYKTHVAAGATMVDFGGWEMPSSTRGIVRSTIHRSCCASLTSPTWDGC